MMASGMSPHTIPPVSCPTPSADIVQRRLETAWNDALNNSIAYFRALLSSSGSSAWKLVSGPTSSPASTVRAASLKGAPTGLGRVVAGDVVVHRRHGKGGEVFRAVVEVDCGSDINADTFRGGLTTPETRAVCESVNLSLSDYGVTVV